MIEPSQTLFDAAWQSFDRNFRYQDDLNQIRIWASELGVIMNTRQAHDVWVTYSKGRCAQWMSVDDKDRVKVALSEYIEIKLGLE